MCWDNVPLCGNVAPNPSPPAGRPPCPPPAPPPRSRPPAATAPARADPSPRKARPAPRATPSSTASPPCTTWSSRTRRPSELEELTARLMAEVGAHERDRGPARAAPRHRLLEGRARRADRGRPVRRRPQAPPAAGRLPVGAGRPADHLRPQALQRRARLPGPAGPRDQPLPQGAAPAAQGRARGMHGRTRGRRAENEPGSPQPPANDDAPAHGRNGRAGGPGTLAKRT